MKAVLSFLPLRQRLQLLLILLVMLVPLLMIVNVDIFILGCLVIEAAFNVRAVVVVVVVVNRLLNVVAVVNIIVQAHVASVSVQPCHRRLRLEPP